LDGQLAGSVWRGFEHAAQQSLSLYVCAANLIRGFKRLEGLSARRSKQPNMGLSKDLILEAKSGAAAITEDDQENVYDVTGPGQSNFRS
jgi:hypothetical protein